MCLTVLEGQAWLLSTCTDGDSWQVVTTRMCDIATTGGLNGHHSRFAAGISCFVTITKPPLRFSTNGVGMVMLGCKRSYGASGRCNTSRQGQNSPLAATRPAPGGIRHPASVLALVGRHCRLENR